MVKRSAVLEPEAEPVAPLDLHQRVRNVMNSHEGLSAARAKLRDLENHRAALMAELDQLTAKVTAPDIELLSEQILRGEELSEHQQTFNRRDVVRQQVAAFDLAIAKQKTVISREVRNASGIVSEEFAGEHRDIIRRMLDAGEVFAAVFDELAKFKLAFDGNEVTPGPGYVYFGLERLQQHCREFAAMRANHWNAWLEQNGL